MKINKKFYSLEESATLRINQAALNKEKQGEEIYHFGFGESPFPVPEVMHNELKKNVDKKSYLPGLGLPELRETIAQFLNKQFSYPLSRDHIAIGPGSKELIFDTLNIIEGTLLLPAPSWVSYAPMARMIGKQVVYIQTEFENFYLLTPELLEKALREHRDEQYLLVLNSPNNPTGQTMGSSHLKEIADLCRQHNIFVLSDEIYALLDYEKSSPEIMHYLPDQTLITGGISKAFGAGG